MLLKHCDIAIGRPKKNKIWQVREGTTKDRRDKARHYAEDWRDSSETGERHRETLERQGETVERHGETRARHSRDTGETRARHWRDTGETPRDTGETRRDSGETLQDIARERHLENIPMKCLDHNLPKKSIRFPSKRVAICERELTVDKPIFSSTVSACLDNPCTRSQGKCQREII